MTSTPDQEASRPLVDDELIDSVPLLPEQVGEAAAEPSGGAAQQKQEAPEEDDAPETAPFEPVAATPTLEQIRLAQEALDEVAPAGSVGDAVGAEQTAAQVLEIRFASNLDGYPDWNWTAVLATVESEAPTVLELALLPSDSSLLAPEWVPWAERLADYMAAKEVEDDDSDDDDDFDDFDDPDASPYNDSRDEPFSP